MAEFQWLVMPAVTVLAVFVTWYLGARNLRNAVAQRKGEAGQREREAGYADGRVDAKLETLEQLLRDTNAKLDAHDRKLDAHSAKLDAHDLLFARVLGETKKLGKRVRRLTKRVEALEPEDDPPTGPRGRMRLVGSQRGLGDL